MDKRRILSAEVMFISANGMWFVYELPKILKETLPKIREAIREKEMKPWDFAAFFYREEKNVERNPPNKTPEATPGQRPPSPPSPSSGAPQL